MYGHGKMEEKLKHCYTNHPKELGVDHEGGGNEGNKSRNFQPENKR